MHNWRNVLPTQSVCLRVPIVLPDEMDEQWAVRGSAQATQFRSAWAATASIVHSESPEMNDQPGVFNAITARRLEA